MLERWSIEDLKVSNNEIKRLYGWVEHAHSEKSGTVSLYRIIKYLPGENFSGTKYNLM